MNEIILRSSAGVTHHGPFRLTTSGLEVDDEPSFDQWAACGKFLKRTADAVQWWVGDWLNYGEKHFRASYRQAMEETCWDYQTLRVFAHVARRFEVLRRRNKLSFAHHREVAALLPDQADTLLGRAEAEGLSVREVRQLARQAKAAAKVESPCDDCCTAADLDALVSRGLRFGTIYADPPWQHETRGGRGATGNHYTTIPTEELARLPVSALAADKSHLHLWTTNGFLPDALALLNGWGFEFKSTFVWVKPQLGVGNYWRSSHEIMLLGVRGGLTFPATDIKSWIQADRNRQSPKPAAVRALIEKVSPGPRLELFGREVAPGWVVWGDQVSRTMFDHDVKEIA